MRGSSVALTTLLVSACSADLGYRPFGNDGNAQRGRTALAQLECGACHIIPGVPGARGHVGPPLSSFGRHVYIAGKFPNTPEVLIAWIRNPPALAPQTAMPAIDMTPAQARDIAAYLYTLQ